MPLYDYKCECGYTGDHFGKLIDSVLPCPKCGGKMKRQISSRFGINMGPVGAYGRFDETLGVYVSTNKQHKEEMRKQGVSLKGDTPKPDGPAWV